MSDIAAVNELVKNEVIHIQNIKKEIANHIIGQEKMIKSILIGLLCDGHILLEGVPGLAKTRTVNIFSKISDMSFSRVQFTPDLLPSDVTGTLIYDQQNSSFNVKKGPVFANILLADEINRAPAKVQSALLECMQEKQVSIGDDTHKLPSPFFVLATQNPIEQEGTYQLPEAQVDRFMMKILVDYPAANEEKQILDLIAEEKESEISSVLSKDVLAELRKIVMSIYVDEKIKDYIVDVVNATRKPESYDGLSDVSALIDYGVSPRASIYMLKAAKANAFLNARGYVSPDDVKAVGYDVLRHRIVLSYEAQAENITPDDIIKRIFDEVQVP